MPSQRQKNGVTFRLCFNVPKVPVYLANEIEHLEAKLKELISIMSRTDYRNKHSRMQALRHSGTGGWFKALPQFKVWSEATRSSVICCHGIRELNDQNCEQKARS
jgi:hypothetical protein